MDDKSIFSGRTNKAVIKTSSPMIEIPYDDFRNLKDKLESLSIEGLTCDMEPPVCKVLGKCSAALKKLKNFAFTIGDTLKYTLDTKDVVLDVLVNKVDYCQVLITTQEDRSTAEIGLGTPFLKSFFTILNFGNYSVGLATKVDSSSYVTFVDPEEKSSVVWIILVVVSLIGPLVGGFILFKQYRKR